MGGGPVITLETAAGLVQLRPEDEALQAGVTRAARVTQAGALVIEGDAGDTPGAVTIRARLAGTGTGDAWELAQAVVNAARQAGSLHRPGRPITYIAGLAAWRLRPRAGGWWELELALQPRQLVGGSGTGEAVTVDGQAVTIDGRGCHVEVGGADA